MVASASAIGNARRHADVDKNLIRVLMPRSRAEVCELEEMLIPTSFHRLLFTRQPLANPPWDDLDSLLAWRPIRTPGMSLFAASAASLRQRRIPSFRDVSYSTLNAVSARAVMGAD
jgi:hypothetical protein